MYNHEDVGFIIVGDNKTPHDSVRFLLGEMEYDGITAEYWDVKRQKNWLKDFPKIDKIIPYNSDNRRNIGFLVAAQNGAEIIISLDDDNYVTAEDYIGSHRIVGSRVKLPTIHSTNNWFNPCSMLDTKPQRRIYSRGYPYFRRFGDKVAKVISSGRIVLNLGLWLGDPDVDAVTNLNERVKVQGFKKGQPAQIMLAPSTYAPINTQNTAFHRDILPCFYYVLMGEEIHGMKIDRYGDIWTGLFAKKVIDHMNDRVAIGCPLTFHRRNPHDLIKDLQSELWGMIINEYLIPIIENMELTGKTYAEAYLDLAQQLRYCDIYDDEQVKRYFDRLTDAMEIWVETCERL
jgi:hypothetical protein